MMYDIQLDNQCVRVHDFENENRNAIRENRALSTSKPMSLRRIGLVVDRGAELLAMIDLVVLSGL